MSRLFAAAAALLLPALLGSACTTVSTPVEAEEVEDRLPFADCTAEGAFDMHPEDDAVDQYRSMSFDHAGNLTAMWFRTRVDSEPTEEWEMENTYESGRLARVEAEYWSNLLPVRAIWTVHHSYDEVGRQVLVETDDRSDGTIEQTAWTEYDAEQLVQESKDIDGDGFVDESIDYLYDEAGHPVQLDIDDDGDGYINSRWMRDFDGLGNLAREDFDALLDGNLDFRLEHSWDDRGLRVEVATDSDVDGEAEQIESWLHDDRRLVAVYGLDEWADGVVDETTTYTWDCP